MKRVVVIDDVLSYVEDIEKVAKEAGYDVLAIRIDPKNISNLVEIVTSIAKFRPNIILIDHNMGEISGDEFAQILGLPKKFFVGTSTVWDSQKDYCARRFPHKGCTPDEDFKKELLEAIEGVA